MMEHRRARKPPLLIEGCGIEQHVLRPRSIAFTGHGLLFRDDREVGAVPCLAIGRDRDGQYVLLHCDARWNVRGAMHGYRTTREVKARAERFHSGISKYWRRTGYSRREMRKRLDAGPRCSICSKAYYDVERMIEIPKAKLRICDQCVNELHRLIAEDLESE